MGATPIRSNMADQYPVEVFEIYMPAKEGGEAVSIHKDNKNLKLVAFIVNGVVIILEKDFILEKSYISERQADQILKNHGK